MPTVELSDTELKNLKVFLNRTQIAGEEVPAFVAIAGALNRAVLIQPPKEEKEEGAPE